MQIVGHILICMIILLILLLLIYRERELSLKKENSIIPVFKVKFEVFLFTHLGWNSVCGAAACLSLPLCSCTAIQTAGWGGGHIFI